MNRDDLFIMKKKKKLTNKALAAKIDCHPSLLSKYFNGECGISLDKEKKLIDLIEQAKEYHWIRVPVE